MSLLISSVYTFDYDNDAATYIQAVEAADGQLLELATRQAINNFVLGCKADGIWTAIKASCILAGARTLSGALVPLVGAAPTSVNFVSGDYNRETGLKADGTKYLDANRNNNADPQDSNHHSVYVTEADSTGIASSYIDGGDTGTGANNIGRSSTVANLYLRSRTSSAGSVASGSATGLIATNRSASTGYVVRASGSETTITAASQTPANSAVFIYGRPPGPTNTSNARLAFYSIGESLDLALLDARVTDLINAFAVTIP
jgi:hypothetical protein